MPGYAGVEAESRLDGDVSPSMSNTIFSAGAALLFVSGVIAACAPPTIGDVVSNAASNASSSPESSVSTSVDGSKTLGSLSDTDATQYCNDLNNYLESHPDEGAKSSCLLLGSLNAFGASGASATAACKDEYGKCMAQDPGAIQIVCDERTPKFKNCTATVAEYSQCQQDAVNAAHDISQDSCNRFMNDGGGASSPLNPASCQTISKKCPGL